MNRILFSACFLIISAGFSFAQNIPDSAIVSIQDTVIQKDTAKVNDSIAVVHLIDSVSKMPRTDSGWKLKPGVSFFQQQLSWQLLQRHPYFGFSKPSIIVRSDTRQIKGKELLFYLFVFLLLIYALIRRAFPKYYKDLFRLFFRNSFKQRQIREQLMENPLPSLLWNAFFVISGGLYVAFLFQHYKLNPFDNFWLIFLSGILCLSGIYFIKFLGLKITGWLFNMNEAANSYIFIVFVINKMIGILLIPFLILVAFTSGDIYSVGINLSLYLVAGLLGYRIILSFVAIRNQVKVNPFHFFLYISAFEIIPLLLIYKGLLLFFRITA